MAKIPDKVLMLPNATYHPFNNLKQENLKSSVGDGMNTTTIKSRVEVTASGRVVFRPLPKR